MPQSLQTWDEGDEHKSMESTAVADPEFIAVDKCLAAATFGLNFDIAELWRLAPDTSSRDTGVNTSSSTRNPSKPTCEHVYAEPATLKTYTGRIMGIWNSGFEDSRALQQHVLSPDLCRQARASGSPLWFKSTPTNKLHDSLPLNTAVVVPAHLEAKSVDEKDEDYFVVFLSLTLHERNKLALDFLGYISRAAARLFVAQRVKKSRLDTLEENPKSESVETHLRDVPVVWHSAENVDTAVEWSDLLSLEFLVSGSRCTIYTAMYREQAVVVKLMRKDVQDAAAVRRELEFELGLLRRIRHENVVRLIGAGIEPEQFLVFAKLDGGTLAQRCELVREVRDRRGRFLKPRPFTYLELLKCGRQLAEALRYLHEEAIPGKMVVHRDLKPDNIGFGSEGDVRLLDLGLSRLVHKSEIDNATYDMSGETGSARYMAPEVAESTPYSEKVDVYSYGLVLWTMCTLKKPFGTMNRDEFYRKVVRGVTRPKINSKWPRPLSDLMQSCWSADMTERPSFAQVSSKLQDMLQDMVQRGVDLNQHITQSAKPGIMTKLGLKNRRSAWF